jgi:hypothetical protein
MRAAAVSVQRGGRGATRVRGARVAHGGPRSRRRRPRVAGGVGWWVRGQLQLVRALATDAADAVVDCALPVDVAPAMDCGVALPLRLAVDRWRREEAWRQSREHPRQRWLGRAGRSSEAWTNVFLRVKAMYRSMYYALAGGDQLEIVKAAVWFNSVGKVGALGAQRLLSTPRRSHTMRAHRHRGEPRRRVVVDGDADGRARQEIKARARTSGRASDVNSGGVWARAQRPTADRCRRRLPASRRRHRYVHTARILHG